MANPLMGNAMPNSNTPNNPMNALMRMMSGGGNPQQMVQMLMQRNPQFNAIMNQVKNSGMTTEQYARQYAKQNGINIDQMVNALRRKGGLPN